MELKDLELTKDELIDVPVVLNDDGDPESGFKVVGSNSQEYQDADRAWKVKNVQKSARRGRTIEASTAPGAQELVELVLKREAAICSACIKELYGFTDNGTPMQLNDTSLASIFAKRPTWRTKVMLAIEAEQLFTKASLGAGAR